VNRNSVAFNPKWVNMAQCWVQPHKFMSNARLRHLLFNRIIMRDLLMTRKTFLFSVTAVLCLAVSTLRADLVNWQIDSNQSWIRLSVPDQAIDPGTGQPIPAWLRDQGSSTSDPVAASWTDSGKRLAAIQGTLSSNYLEGSSIQFSTGTHAAQAVESGQFRPNRDSWNGSNFDTSATGTPAAFAADLTLQGFNRLGFISIYNLNLDAAGSAALSGGAGVWTGAGSLALGALAGTILDLDGGLPGAFIGIPDSRSVLASLLGNADLGLNGSLLINNLGGFNREMILDYDVPFTIVINGLPLSASFEARIVSYATIPEPASISLVGIALSVCCLRRRRNR
jgi:hypothetical protein